MQRTKTKSTQSVVKQANVAMSNQADGTVQWTNRGGTFYMKDGTRVPNGGTFTAHPSDVPKAFRTTIISDDPAKVARLEAIEQATINFPTYTIRQRGTHPYFDVFDNKGRRMNDANLNETEAKALLESLSPKEEE